MSSEQAVHGISKKEFRDMGQRNMQYNSHLTDVETDQRGLEYLHPQPCVFYGTPNLAQPNLHHVIPAPGSVLHHPSEHHDSALFFGIQQYNNFHQQHPVSNLDRPIVRSSNPYNPYMAPPSASRDFVPVNHGAHDQVPFSSSQRVVGIPTDSYGRSLPYMDGGRGSSKRKNSEGIPGVFPYHDALAASSSSVAPMGVWPIESDVTMMDATSFAQPDYRGNETSSIIDNESHRSVRNRSMIVGSDSAQAHNANQLVQGSYVGQPFQLPGNPWLDMQQFSNIGGDNDALAWGPPPTLPYLQGNIGGGRGESGIMGIQGYQITGGSRGAAGFLHPPFLQRHPNVHHPLPPMQGVRGQSISFPSQVASSQSSSVNNFQGVVETGPRYMGPAPPTGFRLYRPQRREDTYYMNTRLRNLPHLRVLPEDGVAMLEVSGYHEVGDSVDRHRDMRLDIDHMSYEELLALGEQIGSVATGLSEDNVARHLKTRSFLSLATSSDRSEASFANQEVDFCVVCQTGYKDQENVGTLDCGHEYHVDCIKKWLLVKNTCPVCKSTALNTERKDL